MDIQKINWKVFFADPATAHPESFFKVFNSWIPNSPEIFVDVADYSHVEDGPWTVLIGHNEDYWLDHTGRKLGVLYNRRTPMKGSNPEKLRMSLQSILKACRRLEQDSEFGGKLRFKTDEFQFLINDRAIASNTPDTFGSTRTEIETVIRRALGTGDFSVTHDSNPKQRFTARIACSKSLPIQTLIDNLS